jgi:hypothetical protein
VAYKNVASVMNYDYSEEIGPVEKIFVFRSILKIFPSLNENIIHTFAYFIHSILEIYNLNCQKKNA